MTKFMLLGLCFHQTVNFLLVLLPVTAGGFIIRAIIAPQEGKMYGTASGEHQSRYQCDIKHALPEEAGADFHSSGQHLDTRINS